MPLEFAWNTLLNIIDQIDFRPRHALVSRSRNHFPNSSGNRGGDTPISGTVFISQTGALGCRPERVSPGILESLLVRSELYCLGIHFADNLVVYHGKKPAFQIQSNDNSILFRPYHMCTAIRLFEQTQQFLTRHICSIYASNRPI